MTNNKHKLLAGGALLVVLSLLAVKSWQLPQTKSAQAQENVVIAAAAPLDLNRIFVVNIPSFFKELVTMTALTVEGESIFGSEVTFENDVAFDGQMILNGDVFADGINIDLGSGEITASNVIYSLEEGSGISISDGQNPTISATDVGSGQNIFKKIKVGSDTAEADENSDTLEFAAGSGISVSIDTGSDKLTITNSTLPGFVKSGTYALLADGVTSVGVGTSTPSNTFELNSGTSGESGFSFTQLTSSSTAGVGGGKVLSVDSGGRMILVVDQTGEATPSAEAVLPSATNGMTLYYNGTNWVASDNLFHDGGSVGISNAIPVSRFHVNTNLASKIGVIVQGYTAQSANLQEWRDINGSVLSYVDANGVFNGSANTSGSLNPGFTLGSVAFQGVSGLTQDNANFFWDDTNNRMGIGTNAPLTKLHISAPSAALRIESSGSNETTLSFKNGSATEYVAGKDSSDYFRINRGSYPGNFADITLSNTGNVGIGTTAPSNKLHVYNGASGATIDTTTYNELTLEDNDHAGISIYNPDANLGRLVFGTPTDAFAASVYWDSTNSLMKVGPARVGAALSLGYGDESDGLRITSAGNVGIGTTAPNAKLEVAAGSLSSTIPYAFKTTATLNSTQRLGNVLFVTGHTTSGTRQAGVDITLWDGNSGIEGAMGLQVGTNSQGGSSSQAIGFGGIDNQRGGMGIYSIASGSGTVNYGIKARAINATTANIGVYGNAAPSTTGSGVGVVGAAIGSSNARVGGYFWTNSTSNTDPTLASGALVANNGDVAIDILRAEDNGSTAFVVKDGGNVGIGYSTPASKLSIGNDSTYNGALWVGAVGANANRIANFGNVFEITTGAGPTWAGQGLRVDGTNRTIQLIGSAANVTDNYVFSINPGGGSLFNAPTSGSKGLVDLGSAVSFAPTSGTATYAVLDIRSTINQTGGANGITRGIYISPTLTAAADWRGIEIANNSGYGVYQSGASALNYFAGNVGIGTATTPSYRLQVSRGGPGTTNFFPITADNAAAVITNTNLQSGQQFGLAVQNQTNNSSGAVTFSAAILGELSHGSGSVDPTNGYGVFGSFAGGSQINNFTNIAALGGRYRSSSGTVTNGYGLRIEDFTVGNAGTMTNSYGVYVGDITYSASVTQTNTPFSFYASDASARNYFAGETWIGTTSDLGFGSTSVLDVNGAIGLPSSGVLISSGGNGFLSRSGSVYSFQSPSTGNFLQFKSNTGAVLVDFDNNGNVGIGTSTPTSPLHVNAGYGANALATFNQLNSGDILTASASGTTKMVLTNAGHLALGTGSPTTSHSTVYNTDSGSYFKVVRNADFNYVDINLDGSTTDIRMGGGGGKTTRIGSWSNDVFALVTNGTERARLDTSGNFGLGTTAFGTSAVNALAIAGSTAPSTSITDGIQLFAVDVAGSHELQVRDEAGNTTTLSPHNFSVIGDKSEELAWSFYSERNSLAINADMTKALRIVEKLSGEKLIFLKDLASGQLLEDESDATKVTELADNGSIGEVAKWNYTLWTFIGEVIFEKPVTFLADITLKGRIFFSPDQVGMISIPAGQTTVKVTFTQTLPVAPVIQLTPQQPLPNGVAIQEVSTSHFVIALPQALAQDTQINWFAALKNTANAQEPTVEVISPASSPVVTPAGSPSPTASPEATPQPTPIATPEASVVPSPSVEPSPTPVVVSDPPATSSAETP